MMADGSWGDLRTILRGFCRLWFVLGWVCQLIALAMLEVAESHHTQRAHFQGVSAPAPSTATVQPGLTTDFHAVIAVVILYNLLFVVFGPNIRASPLAAYPQPPPYFIALLSTLVTILPLLVLPHELDWRVLVGSISYTVSMTMYHVAVSPGYQYMSVHGPLAVTFFMFGHLVYHTQLLWLWLSIATVAVALYLSFHHWMTASLELIPPLEETGAPRP